MCYNPSLETCYTWLSMKPTLVTATVFRKRCFRILDQVSQGREFLIEKDGVVAARLLPFAQRRSITPDIEKGIYPFKGVEPKLTRADIEWLLATHESGGIYGPVDLSDGRQREREGLDLRGAHLEGEDLNHLPLARIRGGLT